MVVYIHIGVTGTRLGMSENQKAAVREYFSRIKESMTIRDDDKEVQIVLHHGDCVGVDVEVANLATEFGFETVAHIPTNEKLRARHASDIIRKPASYLTRNRHIVEHSNLLMVFPKETEEGAGPYFYTLSGGTWFTYRYAQSQGKRTKIFWS